MKIRTLITIFLVLIISAPSASALTADEIITLVYQKLTVYPVDDSGWIQTIDYPDDVRPRDTINVVTVIKNPATLPDQSYKLKLQLVDGTGTILDETAPFYLSSGNTASKTLTTFAPIAEGSHEFHVLRSVWDSYAGSWMFPAGPSFTITVTPTAPLQEYTEPAISDPINQPPNAVITWQSDPTGTVRVSGRTSTDPDDRVVKYHFYVDGEPYAAAADAIDVIGKPGDNIEIRLVVFDIEGATDETAITLAFSGTPNGDVSVHEVSTQYTSPVETGDKTPVETGDKPPIYFEDGALKVPGFGLLFALVAVLCIATFRSKK